MKAWRWERLRGKPSLKEIPTPEPRNGRVLAPIEASSLLGALLAARRPLPHQSHSSIPNVVQILRLRAAPDSGRSNPQRSYPVGRRAEVSATAIRVGNTSPNPLTLFWPKLKYNL